MSEGETTQTQPQEETTPSYTPSEPLISPEVKDVIQLKQFMEGGEKKIEKNPIDRLMETLITDYLMDRLEERRRARKSPEASITPEDIAKAVSSAVTEAVKPLIPQQPKQEGEMPEWAKQIQEQQKIILERMTKEEEEEKTKKIIEEAQRPLKDELEKRDMMIETLKEKIDSIEKNLGESTPPKKDPITYFVETKEKLQKAGLLKEPKEGMIVLGEEGLPIKGEVPWYVAYVPYMIRSAIKTIKEGIEDIALKYMQMQEAQPPPMEQKEELINLPPKPKITQPPPEMQPKTEEKEEVKEEKIELPKEELIKIPEKPVQEPLTEEALKKMKMPQLWKLAKQLGIPKKGKKAELINRILETQKGEEKGEEGKSEPNPNNNQRN